MEVDYVRCTCP